MALDFSLLDADGQPIKRLPDPAGGVCDGAGDFDRLLPLETQLSPNTDFELTVLGRVEAYEDVYFTAQDMPGIINDVIALLPRAKPGPEVNGLNRLRMMAEHGARLDGATIRARGD